MYTHEHGPLKLQSHTLSNYICATSHKKRCLPRNEIATCCREEISERDIDMKLCFPSTPVPSLTSRKKAKVDAYARKMAAKAARPATAMELPKELAEPWKGVIGEVEGLDAALEYLLAFKP